MSTAAEVAKSASGLPDWRCHEYALAAAGTDATCGPVLATARYVAHLDLLDTLQCLPVERERRINALSLLVVKAKRRVDWAWDCAEVTEEVTEEVPESLRL